MANWRKQQGESHHQVAHWRSYSNSRKPPLDNYHSNLPAWEKKFCSSIGSVPWRKIVETKQYMHLFDNVVNWDDSAGKEAFENAKRKYWADINGIPCTVSLPDPDIYIDNVDWNAIVDPELILDLEREALRVPCKGVVRNDQDVVIIGGALYLNDQKLPCTGWGDDEEEQPKPSAPTTAITCWGTNLHENIEVESGQQDHADPAKEVELLGWKNDSWGWNHRENYGGGGGGDMNKMGRGRNGGGYGNWGTCDGHYRRRENNAWSKTPHAYNGNNNENNVNRGRRNYRGGGGRKGNLIYVPKEVLPTPAAW
ncbi:hypothetical protein LR48_Vigan484s001700 [Vigna angularis]|uniref:Uncharacterized protein n=2 Tax=Phaseolus angularis TaxID=3914 RepID=A0A0L9TCE1_PHAAN|nr:uncharacterized protein LOC108321218 [Vigna angularis]XP_017408396.1 uncharacterized protein LOC108321218 [Vigna angularis]KOM28036.1 hypothetical protein LR48_Vigan484s001700 [Vigna angularis]BAT85206.1 hypothetical protein VIGAN_04272600 [Vigna angularis var. angularis]